jgi:hypothetical protein
VHLRLQRLSAQRAPHPANLVKGQKARGKYKGHAWGDGSKHSSRKAKKPKAAAAAAAAAAGSSDSE